MSLLISINTVFKDVEIKGCWFHYCQAIKRNLFAFGLKKRYVSDWNFRFWIRRILVLPLIQVEYLEQAFKIIVKELPSNDSNIIKFIRYFISQWLSGQMSPKYLYPDRLTYTINMVKVVQQIGSNDCGLLVIAYAYDLSLKIDPSNLKYNQDFLRTNFNSFLETSSLLIFKSETLNLGERKTQLISI